MSCSAIFFRHESIIALDPFDNFDIKYLLNISLVCNCSVGSLDFVSSNRRFEISFNRSPTMYFMNCLRIRRLSDMFNIVKWSTHSCSALAYTRKSRCFMMVYNKKKRDI